MPRNRQLKQKMKEKRALRRRLMQISVAVEEYVYCGAPMSAEAARAARRDVRALRRAARPDARALQVVDKLIRCLTGIIAEHESPPAAVFHTQVSGSGAPPPLYSTLDEGMSPDAAHAELLGDNRPEGDASAEPLHDAQLTAITNHTNINNEHHSLTIEGLVFNSNSKVQTSNNVHSKCVRFQDNDANVNGEDINNKLDENNVIDLTHNSDVLKVNTDEQKPQQRDVEVFLQRCISNLSVADNSPTEVMESSQSILNNIEFQRLPETPIVTNQNPLSRKSGTYKDLQHIANNNITVTQNRPNKNCTKIGSMDQHLHHKHVPSATIPPTISVLLTNNAQATNNNVNTNNDATNKKRLRKPRGANTNETKGTRTRRVRKNKETEQLSGTGDIKHEPGTNDSNTLKKETKTRRKKYDITIIGTRKRSAYDLSWVGGMKYVREVGPEECEPAREPEQFWDDFSLPGSWHDHWFSY